MLIYAEVEGIISASSSKMRCDIRRQKDLFIVTPCDTIVFCFWSRPKENEEQFLRQSMRKRRIKNVKDL